ncbi:MAG: DegT/DnrJ/EryC1/StrS family aminotransferase [Steroidobacteraceae bacterium]
MRFYADTLEIHPKGTLVSPTKCSVGIIPARQLGQSVDMDPILEIARWRGLSITEECAHVHMAKYAGRSVRTMGMAADFAVCTSNIVGTMGDAGYSIALSLHPEHRIRENRRSSFLNRLCNQRKNVRFKSPLKYLSCLSHM